MLMAVLVYTTNTCPYCKMAKEFLAKHNVKFQEINVEENPDMAEELLEKSGAMAVPVIDFNGTIIVGFDKHALEKLIKKE